MAASATVSASTATATASATASAAAPVRRGHDLAALAATAILGARTRAFSGDGTPVLRVPGLLRLEAIKVGQTEIPLIDERTYPTDRSGRNFQSEPLEMVWMDKLPDGEPILLRSEVSNHGLWQTGATIYVTGEWGENFEF